MLNNIYVDQLKSAKWGFSKACHLFTTGDIDILHSFAESIGLKRKWFQNDIRLLHYDLTANKQHLAIQMGAQLAKNDLVKEVIRDGRRRKGIRC